ncbi:hypothetical protein GWK47_032823 [Chionoecetes opilio]|uniref:Uncharacterized protein n=1 Tax=Chionoecetes opilio TaxID=41210 RepID=A0A8J5D0K6_CHIOP|nr:hypothetical protein GWK47_032823 [Chionoecetes opilio]
MDALLPQIEDSWVIQAVTQDGDMDLDSGYDDSSLSPLSTPPPTPSPPSTPPPSPSPPSTCLTSPQPPHPMATPPSKNNFITSASTTATSSWSVRTIYNKKFPRPQSVLTSPPSTWLPWTPWTTYSQSRPLRPRL